MLVICTRVGLLLLIGIALYAGLRPQPIPEVVPHFDLILHAGVFFVMSALWAIGLSRRSWLFGVGFLLLLGMLIELWQGWQMPARTASLTDMAANATGVFLGALFYFLLARILPQKF